MWRNPTFNGVEIGPSRLSLITGKVDSNQNFEITGGGQLPVRGLHKGVMLDAGAFAGALDELFSRVQSTTSRGSSTTYISLDESLTTVSRLAGNIAIPARSKLPIQQQVKELLWKEAQQHFGNDTVLLDLLMAGGRMNAGHPRQTTLDAYVEAIAITIPRTLFQHLQDAFRKTGLKVNGLTTASWLAAELLTSPEERAGTTLFLSFGETHTSALLFEKGLCRAFDRFPFGTDLLHEDVAYLLQMKKDDAKLFAQTHGTLDDDAALSEDFVKVTGLTGSTSKRVSRKVIQEIMSARMLEMALTLQEWLSSHGTPHSEIAVTGSVLSVGGAVPFLQRVWGRPVHPGSLPEVTGRIDLLEDPRYLAAVGACFLHKELRHHTEAPTANLMAG